MEEATRTVPDEPQSQEEIHEIYCPEEVMEGKLMTKTVRHESFGRIAGGAGSMSAELFQSAMVEKGTRTTCEKTNMRINLRTIDFVCMPHPNKRSDGFDYTEDFDGKQTFGEKSVYLNFKCVVGNGGSQTRTLREVYNFVEGQLQFLQKRQDQNLLFANILDGDVAHNNLNKFEYLRGLPCYSEIASQIYVGDLRGYFTWINSYLGRIRRIR